MLSVLSFSSNSERRLDMEYNTGLNGPLTRRSIRVQGCCCIVVLCPR